MGGETRGPTERGKHLWSGGGRWTPLQCLHCGARSTDPSAPCPGPVEVAMVVKGHRVLGQGVDLDAAMRDASAKAVAILAASALTPEAGT